MPAPIEHVDEMQDHWWWRPGWRAGRHFYACHFTMGEYPELVKLVRRYQEALRPFPGLDLIPSTWLHLTMQGIGFVDDLDDEQVARLEPAIRERLAELPAPVVAFHRPVVRPEAVYLPAEPPAPLTAVRHAVREVIGHVLGADNVELAPEHVQGYRPHVSLAYSNAAQSAEPIAATLSQVEAEPVVVTLHHLGLLEFHRDHRMYQWTRSEQVRIGR
ncbi:2'-5' RNA ligase family protein [Micromonospora inositola]|uniref:2'-5' RNA ligase n=1 Tax=Micromonospora inositola TaxID=47865 RepID=A0A1C5HT73_9ACTN|nr:2'-5' RNA ligase family protein [Micromonospora inositola]SCG49200.1 2'-5' RNA ligase [Micromonospora inositola]